jgi:CMP/dCMP kinase
LIVAIDGYAACGKSTLAKALAKALDYRYIDSGAMYRAVTYFLLKNSIPLDDEPAVESVLKDIHIEFERIDGNNHTILNGEDIEEAIRSQRINQHVSLTAAIPSVRKKLVEQQQRIGQRNNLVMDGRDIGTVVFPHADVKIFMNADLDVRTRRRYLELTGLGFDISMDEVKRNLIERDRIDTTREDSPLIKAPDAVEIDTSGLSPEEQLNTAIKIINRIRE